MDISVLIATRNRAPSLKETLSDLAAQVTDGRFKYEVLVMDNGSDGTKDLVAEMAPSFPAPLRWIHSPIPNKPAALNKGIPLTNGRFLAFTDDDVRLPPDWLKTIYRNLNDLKADGVGGPTEALFIGERPEWMSDRLVAQLGIIDYGDVPYVMNDHLTAFIGPNSAYRKQLYAKLGGYDEERNTNSEDVEWYKRVYRAGYRLLYDPKMKIKHKVDCNRWTKKAMAVRFLNQGQACALGHQEHTKGFKLFRIPVWVIRYFFELHWMAFKSWREGNKDEALWHWLRRYIYLGIIVNCFKDWYSKKPAIRVRPVLKNLSFPGTES